MSDVKAKHVFLYFVPKFTSSGIITNVIFCLLMP